MILNNVKKMSLKLIPVQNVTSLPDLSRPLGAKATRLKAAGGEFAIERLTLEGGRRSGVEMLVIDTGRVRAALLPTRGLSLWRANIDGLELGWRSPVDGPVHPQWVALAESGGLGWLDGFDELLVRCGLRNFGAPDFDPQTGRLLFPLHGRIGNLPTDQLEVELDTEHSLLHVRGVVNERRFLQYNLQLLASYTFSLGASTIEIRDTVTNVGDVPTTMQMLYHINVGKPLLEAGAKMHLAANKIVARNDHAAKDIRTWDTYNAPEVGYSEQVYFSSPSAIDNGWTTALLHCADASRGFAVHYKTDTLPYFTQWKNTVGERDGYVTGLEPGTGFPNPRSFEDKQKRTVALNGNASIEFQLKLEGITRGSRVQEVVSSLQSKTGRQIQTADFDSDWCLPKG